MARDIENARRLSREWYRRDPQRVKDNVEKWRNANRERVRETARLSMARQRKAAREAIRSAYGGRCACCGESEPLFLALDHVNNDGHKDRTSSHATYRRAIRDGFPDTYQLLCHNCNFGKGLNGGVCPHPKTVD